MDELAAGRGLRVLARTVWKQHPTGKRANHGRNDAQGKGGLVRAVGEGGGRPKRVQERRAQAKAQTSSAVPRNGVGELGRAVGQAVEHGVRQGEGEGRRGHGRDGHRLTVSAAGCPHVWPRDGRTIVSSRSLIVIVHGNAPDHGFGG